MRRVGYTSRRVHAIVAVCASIKDGLVAAGVPAAKIEVIYSGTDLERFHPGVDGGPVRRELGLSPEHALDHPGRRPLVARLAGRAGGDARGGGRLRPRAAALRRRAAARIVEIAERAREAGLDGRVLALGHRDDVPAILNASDVVVDASYAGLGITGSIREALACERPVVATALEGMPELVLDGETGRLVPPRDPAALAAAVLAILGDPTAAQAMARAGRKRVEAHFSLRAKLDATEALYRRLVAAEGRGMRHALAIYRRLLPLMRPYLPVLILGAVLALVVASMEGRDRVAGEAGHGRHLHPPRPGHAAPHPAAAAGRLPRQGRRPLRAVVPDGRGRRARGRHAAPATSTPTSSRCRCRSSPTCTRPS